VFEGGKEKMNFKNDSNNNSNQNLENASEMMKDKDEVPTRDEISPRGRENHVNGKCESPKAKIVENKSESPTPISQFLNSLINFRRDEMTLNLNNLLTGANQSSLQPPVAANLLLNDLNRNFLVGNFGEHSSVNPALASLVANHQQYSKYGRGACKWPGCDMTFDDLQTFTK
jgi:hypothetical protein